MEGKARVLGLLLSYVVLLKTLFPEIVTDGAIDFDAFRRTFGEHIDERPERYSFTWHGKSGAARIAQTPSSATLRPCREASLDWEKTRNIFIEGDNLEVLKLANVQALSDKNVAKLVSDH